MKIKLKTLLKTIGSSALAISIVAPIYTISSCTKVQKEVDDGQSDNDNAITYHYVKFLADSEFPDTKFVGETNVKVRDNSFYAEVVQPTAICGGLRFKYWSLKKEKDESGEWKKIDPTMKITGELKVYPVFELEIKLSNCVGFTAIEKTAITVFSYEGQGQSTDPKELEEIPQDLHYTLNYGLDDWPNINEVTNHTIVLEPGENVFFKGKGLPIAGTEPIQYSGFNKGSYKDQGSITTLFAFSGFDGEDGAVNMGGSIMGLIDDGTGDATKNLTENCFANVFFDDDEESTFKPAIKYVTSTFLPSTQLAENCYDSLFQHQKTLLAAPDLPATTLASHCYNNIFADCNLLNYLKIGFTDDYFSDSYTLGWLEDVATTGKAIFNGTVPEDERRGGTTIPAGWAVEKSPGEGSVITVTCPDTAKYGENYEYVDNHPYEFKATVSGEGVSQDVTWVSTNTAVASVNPSTGYVTGISPGECDIVAYSKVDYSKYGSKHIKIRDVDLDDCLKIECTVAADVSWEYGGTGTAPTFSYSKDGNDWFIFWYGNTVEMAAGDVIYVKGNNPNGLTDGASGSNTHFTFDGNAETSTSKVNLSGNIMALVDDARGEFDTIPCNYCFNKLFHDETAIVDIDDNFLSCKNITNGCYYGMFDGCSSITGVPNLPATTLKPYCYTSMFSNCSSITVTPDLNSESLAVGCYESMFSDCTSLKETSILPATTAADYCYQMMFDGCTGLNDTNAKIGYVYLTKLATEACYQMFGSIATTTSGRFSSSGGQGYNALFVCPSWEDFEDPTLGMFEWHTRDDDFTPTENQTWYFYGTVKTKPVEGGRYE